MSRIDTKALRARAVRVSCGSEERQEWAKDALRDAPALCARVDELEAAIAQWQYALHDVLPNEPVPHRDVNSPSSLSPKDVGAAFAEIRADNDRLRAAITQALVQLGDNRPMTFDRRVREVTESLRAALQIPEGP